MKKIRNTVWYITSLLFSVSFCLASFSSAAEIYRFWKSGEAFHFVFFIVFFVFALFCFRRAKANSEKILLTREMHDIASEVNEKMELLKSKKLDKQEEFKAEKEVWALLLQYRQLLKSYLGEH